MFNEIKVILCITFLILKLIVIFLGRKRTERSIHVEAVLQYEPNNVLIQKMTQFVILSIQLTIS